MADQETAIVQIDTDAAPIDAWEFAHFLYLFRATYAAASERLLEGLVSPYSSERELSQFAERLRAELVTLSDFDVADLAKKDLTYNLTILDIRRENPLDIVFGGIAVALAVAVIISGGEFKAPGFKVKLPPLGTGIAKLRDAFGKKQLPKRRR